MMRKVLEVLTCSAAFLNVLLVVGGLTNVGSVARANETTKQCTDCDCNAAKTACPGAGCTCTCTKGAGGSVYICTD